jgi:hypothetical protein
MKPTYIRGRADLINVPLPKETRTYKPVSNEELITVTLESIHQSGFTVEKEVYSSAREGMVSNGRYLIKDVNDSEMQLMVGWQNSYDKSATLKFAIGTNIMICSNGCVSGDWGAFRKKHTGEIQTFAPGQISEFIRNADQSFIGIQSDREAMKQIEISPTVRAELLGRLLIEEQVLQSSQINIIRREIVNPTYDYHSKGSLWELYQFTTFALKEDHPSTWLQDHHRVHTFYTGIAGILHASKPVLQIREANQLDLFDGTQFN